jgi:monoamine oxidase
VVRSRRAFEEAARGKVDTSCLHVLPRDLGDWRPTVEFFLGPFSLSKDLSEISVADVSRLGERETAAFCRQGFGALLARLAEGLPVELSTPVTRIDSSRTLEIQTSKGRIAARAVIVTASSSVLASGKIQFAPDLPKRQLDAFNRLRLGSYDRIALELPGNRLGLQRDDLVFEKADGPRTAALLANVSGSNLVYVDVAGSFGRDLAAKGKGEMTAFALDWLDKLFGADARKAVKRSHVTQWNSAPYALGASSAATVGQQVSRRIMMEPLRERIFFAGEAVHETLWGSVGGAWESGERAADAALRLFGIGVKPQATQPQRPQRSKR